MQEQQLIDTKAKIIRFFSKNNVLLSLDVLNQLDQLQKGTDLEKFYELIISKIKSKDFLFLNKDLKELLDSTDSLDTNWLELEKSKVLLEKHKDDSTYKQFINNLQQTGQSEQTPEQAISNQNASVKVVFSYEKESVKRSVQHFISLFNCRYKAIRKILQCRKELQSAISINRLAGKRDKENVSIIGLVSEKGTTKNNNISLVLEDPTGCIKVMINKNKPELLEMAKDLVLDEVIGIIGVLGENIIFANNLFLPDVPLSKELKKSPDEVYAIFISDTHFGSKHFLNKQFERFLDWLNGEVGNEAQREIVKKIRYMFIVGDLVEGVGIYPNQEADLEIKDVYEQYREFAKYLRRIPSSIKIIICPGNHDAMRIAEPQPPLYKDFAKEIWDIPNVTMVSNPSVVNIHSSDVFSGFDVLMYHGFSFIYYADTVESIRKKGGQTRSDLILKFLLQRRHLAPTHTANLYLPDATKDHLVIEKVPDFFVSGHIHRISAMNYRNVTLLNCSTWISETESQAKQGIVPQPCRVPIVNLQTRGIKILKF